METGGTQEKSAQRKRSGLRSNQKRHDRVDRIGGPVNLSTASLTSKRETILWSHKTIIADHYEVSEEFFLTYDPVILESVTGTDQDVDRRGGIQKPLDRLPWDLGIWGEGPKGLVSVISQIVDLYEPA